MEIKSALVRNVSLTDSLGLRKSQHEVRSNSHHFKNHREVDGLPSHLLFKTGSKICPLIPS